VLLNALFIQRQHFSPSKRLKLNGAKKRNKEMRAHYFSVVSAWRALKYHHHLREPLRSFIPAALSATPNPTIRAKPVPRMFMLLWCWPPPQQREPSPSPERGTKKINETLW
jgi:hypothetical protein